MKLFINNNVYPEFILDKCYKYLNWKYFTYFREIIFLEEFVTELIKSKKLYQNKKVKNFLIEFIFLNNAHFTFQEKGSHFFFKLFDIETDSTLGFLEVNPTVLNNFGFYETSIVKIKDLRENKLLDELYNKVKLDEELSLVITIFDYLLNPSIGRLKKCFLEIKEKYEQNKNITLYAFQFNWQLIYIINEVKNESSIEMVYNQLENFGKTYEDFIKYEETLCDKERIFEKSDFIDIYDTNERNDNFFEFYNNLYIKNKLLFSDNFLHKFIFNAKKLEKGKELDEVILDVIRACNNTKENFIKGLTLTAIVALVNKNELMNFDIDLNISSRDYFHHGSRILGDDIITLALKNILDLINFEEKETSYQKLIFMILSKERRFNFKDIDFSMLFELNYTNKELQICGYLSSLMNKDISSDENKMKIITDFLLVNIQKYHNIFDDTIDIVMNNGLQGKLIKNLLLELYGNIEKDTIRWCELASKYENSFKRMFENKVIEF